MTTTTLVSGTTLAQRLYKQIDGISIKSKTVGLLNEINAKNVVSVIETYDKLTNNKKTLVQAISEESGFSLNNIKNTICYKIAECAQKLKVAGVYFGQYFKLTSISQINAWIKNAIAKIKEADYVQSRIIASVATAEKEYNSNVTENIASNDSIAIRKYVSGCLDQKAGIPWCAAFANYVTAIAQGDTSLFDLPRQEKINGKKYVNNACSSQALRRVAEKLGLLKDASKCKLPKVGDLIVWKRTKGHGGHIGIVTEVDEKNGTYKTKEGNTDNALKERTYEIGDTHPKSDNGEYNSCKLVGFIDMEEYYKSIYRKEHTNLIA